MAGMSETSDGFCMACGAPLPQDARFCPTCGVAQTPDALERLRDKHTREEFCEIERREHSLSRFVFIARAVGGDGLFEAACSAQFKRDPRERWDAENEEALNALIRKLGADGWEPTGRGDGWFEYRFRREVEYDA
jgi:ribosomal protein L40E